MSDKQIGGDHYAKHKIQPWDIIDEYGLNYYEGNIIKYVLRHRDKNGLQDLQKASHYLEKLIADMDKPRLSFPASRIHTLENGMEIDLDDGWIPWGGGECPVHGEWMVVVVSRADINERQDAEMTAEFWDWEHNGGDGDILAYKVIT